VTLLEMSVCYETSASAIRVRITQLREEFRQTQDPEYARALRQRMAELLPLLQESRELAALTAHYYERGYYKNGKYTL